MPTMVHRLLRFGLVACAAFLGTMIPVLIAPGAWPLFIPFMATAVCFCLPVFGLLAWRFGWRGMGAFVLGGVVAGFAASPVLAIVLQLGSIDEMSFGGLARSFGFSLIVFPIWSLLGALGGFCAGLAWHMSEDTPLPVFVAILVGATITGARIYFA